MSKIYGVVAVLVVICIVNVYSTYTFQGIGHGSSGPFERGYSGILNNENGGLSDLSDGYTYGGLSSGLGYTSGGNTGNGATGISQLQLPIMSYRRVRPGTGMAHGFGKGIGQGIGLKGFF
ncbi:hypothetical protein ACJMK2_041886 [Sinanodonta woodiana]|uniref:Uncharacterized protein n=1 Tax=Sinanodonta woodiana TaxID=1069815 RepID=A0ABD3W6L5_SINWO